ncbi:MAG: hypothetical protein M3P01_03190 [Actinomycetota bacterium]|nr:hypothetical protein [Actinomycetota bacterium]
MRSTRFGLASIAVVLIALLVIVVLAYDRGKKCGAWESEYPGQGAKSKHALHTKPLACLHLH